MARLALPKFVTRASGLATAVTALGLTAAALGLTAATLGLTAVALALPLDIAPPTFPGAGTPSLPAITTLGKPPAAKDPTKAVQSLKGVPLHHLGADAGQLRFEGESVSRAWPVYMTPAEAKTKARFRLAYTNAVSVNPELSSVTISVNDVVLGQEKIMAPSDPAVIDIDIPDNLLVTGYNAIRISVNQRHRVDCSMNATYELWTAVHGPATGIVFPDLQDTVVEAADLPAIIADGDGSKHIRVVLPRGADMTGIDRALRAVQAVALRGAFLLPAVDVSDELGDAPGVSVLAGTSDDLRARGFGAFIRDDSPVAVLAGAKPGHTNIVISGATLAEVDKAIDDFAAGDPAEQVSGSPAGLGLAAVADGARVAMGASVTLKKLEAVSTEFTGRLFRTGLDIVLPPDFYAADYGKAVLRIDAGYAAGLDRKSQILVRVNGKDASSLPLPDPRGDIFRKRAITVSLADLRPGFNHVTIEAELGNAADTACDPTRLDESFKRFVLLEQSELVMPRVARIAHLPNLAATTASGFPYATRQHSAKVLLARTDTSTIAAAATFLARAAVGAGRILDTLLVTRAADIENSSALVFGAIDDLPPALVEHMGLDAAGLRRTWASARATKASAETKAARPVPAAASPDTAVPVTTAAPRANRGGDLYDQWSHSVKADKSGFDPYAAAVTWFEGFFGGTKLRTPFLREEERAFVPPASARLIIAQHAAPGSNETWTLVTGATGDTLVKDMAKLIAPTVWRQLDGAAAAFDSATGTVTLAPSTRGYFMATSDWSPANLRLIAAGWFSSNLEYYVLALFVLCCLTGALTAYVVRFYGAKTS